MRIETTDLTNEPKDWIVSIDAIVKFMKSDGPFFYGRIGGNETDTVQRFSEIKKSSTCKENLHYNFIKSPVMREKMFLMKKYTGYYDKTNNIDREIDFCEKYLSLYKDYDACSFVGVSSIHYCTGFPLTIMTDQKEKDIFLGKQENFLNFLEQNLNDISLYSYSFIENAVPFLNSFKIFAEGKKILLITPFTRSIELQKSKLNSLFNGYQYPNFEMLLYKTPITTNENNIPMFEQFPHNNWFETVDHMCKEISNIDFDIALLGCASYSLPLGSFIKNSMGKKVIYLGGILQLCFGVMGTRWQGYSLNFNTKEFIYPIETTQQTIEQKKDQLIGDGVCAYF